MGMKRKFDRANSLFDGDKTSVDFVQVRFIDNVQCDMRRSVDGRNGVSQLRGDIVGCGDLNTINLR
jgi:hypothetical protein